MAALGDSITVAYDIKSLLAADPTYSWSTGTQAAVNSVYTRLEARDTSAPNIAKANHAVSGAKIADLAGQAGKVTQGTELVTILMGANDACTKTEAEMTPVADFRTRADSALTALAGRGVKQVVVASIPDVYKLWQVGKGSSSARFVWGLYGICQSMLKSPSSIAEGGSGSPAPGAEACRRLQHGTAEGVFGDRGFLNHAGVQVRQQRVFNTSFALTDISKVDYFHPSVSGQALLAQKVYTAAGF